MGNKYKGISMKSNTYYFFDDIIAQNKQMKTR